MLKEGFYNLTDSQKNIWDTELYFSNSSMNNLGGYVFVEDNVELPLLEQALNLFIQKNDAIRFHIVENEDSTYPCQYVNDYSFVSFDVDYVNSFEDVEKESKNFIRVPFSLFDNDLYSFKLFKLPDGRGGFYLSLHHLISDAWNTSLLIGGVMNFYAALIKGEHIDDYDEPSYIDYIKSQENYRDSSRFNRDYEFWQNQFKDEPSLSFIANSGEQDLNTEATRRGFKLSQDLYSRINDFCTKTKCSIYTFFMAIYSLYVADINNVSSPILGTPVLNRSGVKEKHTAGMFISTVPFKVSIDKTCSFSEFVKQVGMQQLSIFKHQKYPYNELLQSIKKSHNLSENLYDMVLSYQNARNDNENCDVPYITKWVHNGHILDSLEVHFFDMDDTGNLDIFYDYQINKFNENEIDELHSRILRIVEDVLDNPNINLGDIKIVDKREELLILNSFNSTSYGYDKNKTILDIFEDNVRKHEFDTALVYENEVFSYFDLDNLTNRLANYLLSLKLPKNSVIGVDLRRSDDTVICMLAILKANLAYMLIDHELPEDRINFMLKNANSPLLITATDVEYVNFENKVFLEDININDYDSDLPKINEKPDDPISVVYTSGSTGQPKGVLLKRFSVVNLVNGYRYSMHVDSLKSFLSICSVSFDMFAAEVWIALLCGKKLVLANEEEAKIPVKLCKLIEDNKCEFMLITSSKLDLLLSNPQTASCLKYIKAMQLGGEVLNPAFYDKLLDFTDSEIYNGYGPSETTSCCTCKHILSNKEISLGKPLPNVQVYICNDDLKLCPIGVTGELCIAGDGVSYGYINNKETTDKSFVKNPFGEGLLYRSGDLAKWNALGEIEYVGRNDFQIKIRGLRVELDEINNKILAIDGISKSVTIVRKVNGIDCICSFVVNNSGVNGGLNTSKIKEKLGEVLPHYMVPSHIVFMSELPLSANGKVDRKKLPDIIVRERYIPPKTKSQKYIAHIFEKFLGIERVSVDSDFFELGGDSLIAIKIITQINCDINIDLSIKEIFEHTTVLSLSKYLLTFPKAERAFINAINKDGIFNTSRPKAPKLNAYPATSAQKRIFYSVQTDNKTLAYNTPGGFLLDGVPSVYRLENAFTKLIRRHEALRTYFIAEDNEVKQKVVRPYSFKLEVVEANFTNLDNLVMDFSRPFDLGKAPLFKAMLVVFENNKSALLLDFHHIICDGDSISTFINELCDLYNGVPITKKEFDYTDFTFWEQNYFDSKDFEKDKKYWLEMFKGELPVLTMPTSFSRPSTFTYAGAKIGYELPEFDKVSELCRDLNTTPYMLLLTAFYILLYKYTNQTDIIVGTPTAGRNIPETAGILGMFVNTLALRCTFEDGISFKELLTNVTQNCLESFEHGNYPFDAIAQDLQITRDPSRNPIFDTMFVYQNEDMPDINLKKLDAKYYVPDNKTSKFDFLLEVTPKDDYFKLNLEYRTDLFKKDFMEHFLKHYEEIVKQIVDNIDIKIKDFNMLDNAEMTYLLNIHGKNYLRYPRTKSIIELFEEQVAKTPRNTAVIYKGKKYSYKNLNDKVNSFAKYLYVNGVKKGDIVGTFLDRSYNLIVAMLAIIKCGAVYLPISKHFPDERIAYITKNSKLSILIVDSETVIDSEDVKSINIDSALNNFESDLDKKEFKVSYDPDDAIYSIYTSGSTGKPKGVLVTNKNLNNFIHSFNKYYNNSVGPHDTLISTTSICFDVCIWEFFFSLLNGCSLYLYESDTIEDIFDFCSTLVREKITIAYLPPNILNEVCTILGENKKFYLEKILLGVEPIRSSIVKKFYDLNPTIKIVNGYGPTETTICCTACVVNRNILSKYNTLPIGKPFYNLHAYVLDKNLHPVPVGVPGELYISGDNVSNGYLNNTRMTNEKFIECPFETNSSDGVSDSKVPKMYATGDVVKIMPDKNLCFIGRNDNQIKIKGHRIEINEIINAISCYPSITKCFISVKRQKIAAFFTAYTKIVVNDLRNFLTMKIPFYAVPNFFVQLESFPLTINGKIDKKELDKIKLRSNDTYEEPRNDFEKSLSDLWKKFLNVEKVGINDNFFNLGGDSLIAIRMQVEAFKIGLDISYSDIFAFPTIKQLSEKSNLKKFSESFEFVEESDNNSFYINNDDNKAEESTYKVGSEIKDYDYSRIDDVLEKSVSKIPKKFRKVNLKNVLLTGATGFIGVHVLDKLLSDTDATVYCLIRGKKSADSRNKKTSKNEKPIDRLKKILHFYFDNKYDKFIGNRVKIIEGDISYKHLGLKDEVYQLLGKKVSVVINSAAIVKHYGLSDEFDRTNVDGVQNVVNFCNNFNCHLYHLSTLSVSGNAFLEASGSEVNAFKNETPFYESDLYIGQEISNLYVYTKFIGERLILNSVARDGLRATIMRLGNITSRASDGKFQINISENAYLNRLLSFIRLGAIPEYMLEGYGEFTPVDYVADAICKMVTVKHPFNVLHIFNHKHIEMEDLISVFNEYGLDMKILPEEDFLKIVDKFLKEDSDVLSGIINDFDKNKKLVYESNVMLQNEFSNEVLAKRSFEWFQIGKEYLFTYLDYLKDLGLI